MSWKDLRAKSWFPMAAALCIGAACFAILTNLGSVFKTIRTVLSYFSPVVPGCLIAYLINPLAKLYRNRLFFWIRSPKLRTSVSNILAIVTVIAFIVLCLLVILPQLVDSVVTFADNLEGYMASLERMLDKFGLSDRLGLASNDFDTTLDKIAGTVTTYVVNNITSILNTTAGVGRGLIQFAVGFILALYILAEKPKLKAGSKRLLRAGIRPARYDSVVEFLHRCDRILNSYIAYNLLDALVVGAANALFMTILNMPYAGLVSFAVAVTNLIPTFGPIVGAAIGAFVLVLVRPWYAVLFLAFTVVLQICDGYIIKPRLFGNTLGVSGLWILIGVIIGGRVFGMTGVLMAIPAVAILDFSYRESILPWLEQRRAMRGEGSGPEPPAE